MVEQQDKENEDGTKKEVTLVQTVHGNYEGFTKREVIKAREAREAQAMLGNPSEKDFQGLVSGNLIPNFPIARADISNAGKMFGPDLASIRWKTEVIKAREARKAQAMLGNPSEKDFQGLVSGNLIPNCPIARADISNAGKMFGPDLASIHGKTVQRMPAPVVADYVAIPQQLVDANKAVTLAADMFFVDGIAFLITVSRRIKFVTTKHLPVRTAMSLSKYLQQVLLVYGWAGFRVRSILMDGEFEKVKGLMPTVECNTTAAKEHISKAERSSGG